MRELQRIVVGIDVERKGARATSGSSKALTQAAWLAERTGATLTLVASTHFDEFSLLHQRGQEGQVGPEELARGVLEELSTELATRDIASRVVVVEERAWLAITRTVLRREADLVVVGKRTKEQSKGRKLGAVATKLLRKCPCPVWVVKPEHDLVQRLVLAATDLSPVGDQATRYAAFVAAAHDCELHLVHAYQVPLALQMSSSTMSEDEYAEELEKLRSSAQAHMEEALKGSELKKPATLHVVRSSPTVAIRESVEHLNPDLLVMGMISRSGIAGLLVGDTAERLLDCVDCSLLTVKPENFITPVTLE